MNIDALDDVSRGVPCDVGPAMGQVMHCVVDIQQMRFIFGPVAYKFGDDWLRSVQANVESDRWVYLSSAAGAFAQGELKTIIRHLVRLSRTYGWPGIRWLRKQKDGSFRMVRFPIHHTGLAYICNL